MTRFDATGRRALWTSGQLGTADLTTSPQAQQQQQKRSIHMVHKPVNSVCYRHPTNFNRDRDIAVSAWLLDMNTVLQISSDLMVLKKVSTTALS